MSGAVVHCGCPVYLRVDGLRLFQVLFERRQRLRGKILHSRTLGHLRFSPKLGHIFRVVPHHVGHVCAIERGPRQLVQAILGCLIFFLRSAYLGCSLPPRWQAASTGRSPWYGR